MTTVDGIESVARWCRLDVDVAAFADGLFDRLASVVPFDGAFLAAVDPATLLYTRAFRRDMPADSSGAFLSAEFGGDDAGQLRHLVRTQRRFGWLDETTGGDRSASVRFRAAMLPFGLGDEVRVPLVASGMCWGLVCVHRAAAVAGFTGREADALSRLGPHVAGALRRALVLEVARRTDEPDGPGVVLLAADGSVRSSTVAGARWLEELASLDSPAGGVPTVVSAIAGRLREPCGVSASPASRARVRAPSGAWLTVHAAELVGDDGTIAVVVEPASAVTLAPLIIAAYGLTARESEVTGRVLAGLPRKTIAAELRISTHTVNDHVKAVFDKTGVSSAGQLRRQIFQQRPAVP